MSKPRNPSAEGHDSDCYQQPSAVIDAGARPHSGAPDYHITDQPVRKAQETNKVEVSPPTSAPASFELSARTYEDSLSTTELLDRRS